MFAELEEINSRPAVFERYTAEALWADAYRAQQMLRFHLDGCLDVSSRKTECIVEASQWIIDNFGLGPSKAVCDFGCGPGLYTARLAQSGARVAGIDFSLTAIAYARRQAQRSGQAIDYVHANYLQYSWQERFDLITLIMCDFCALSPAQRRHLLAIWHDCLSDDGAILLDVYSMTAFAAREERCFYEKNQLDHFWHPEDYYAFVNTFIYQEECVVLDSYSIFPEQGTAETVYNWLQYFSPEALAKELQEAGFEVERLLQDVAGRPYSEQHAEFAVVARKKRS
ncbi:MAG: class I SAM-dependent methyltransferase [Pseudomonadota bacterium]